MTHRFSKRRIKPRFFVFVLAVIGVAGWGVHLLSFRPSRIVNASQRMHQGSLNPSLIQSWPTTRQLQATSFDLPQPLWGFASLAQGSLLEMAGGHNSQGLSSFSATITPQGLIQGPSGTFARGSFMLVSHGHFIVAGGVEHAQPITAGVAVASGHTVPHVLPEALAYAGTAIGPHGSTWIVGGQSTPSLSRLIWHLHRGHFSVWGHLPLAVENPAIAVSRQFLVVAGGLTTQGQDNPDIWIFARDTHRLVATLRLPSGLENAQLVSIRGNFWLLGGTHGTSPLSTIWLIHHQHLYRASVTLPTPLSGFGTFVRGSVIWLVGGMTPHGPTNHIEGLRLVPHPQ
ncbi:MAG: hypothetical protein OWR62_13105 [Sulfobacillus thermotolerans]|nr:hypothetical protein [Sulfobacillus thermotolerans]